MKKQTFRVKNTNLEPYTLVNLFPRRVLREICRNQGLYIGKDEEDSANNICTGRSPDSEKTVVFYLEFEIQLPEQKAK